LNETTMATWMKLRVHCLKDINLKILKANTIIQA
jgi:hypothetical protein